jgi:hypothetical protein
MYYLFSAHLNALFLPHQHPLRDILLPPGGAEDEMEALNAEQRENDAREAEVARLDGIARGRALATSGGAAAGASGSGANQEQASATDLSFAGRVRTQSQRAAAATAAAVINPDKKGGAAARRVAAAATLSSKHR